MKRHYIRPAVRVYKVDAEALMGLTASDTKNTNPQLSKSYSGSFEYEEDE